jgi:hypothetical protein
MCGVPAQVPAPIQTASESKRTSRAPEVTFSGEQAPQFKTSGSGKSIGIGIAVAIVLLVPLFLFIHSWQPSQSSPPAISATKPESQPEPVVAATPDHMVKSPAKKVHATASPGQQLAIAPPVPAEDPAELWKGVRSGNARAEVTLAKLYLDGNSVPQSCEQTHMLLLAASKKGSKAADSLLAGAYAARCPQGLDQ